MKNRFLLFGISFLCVCSLPPCLVGGDKDEHREIAQQSLRAVLAEYREDLHGFLVDLFVRDDSLLVDQALWMDKSFGEISAYYSGKDISFARCQEPGKTVLQQLQSCPSALVDNIWDTRKSSARILSAEQSDKNAIVNYLLHHLTALRFAGRAAQTALKEDLQMALTYEAIAISYLTDAFSSGHLLLSLNKFLANAQRSNYQNAHDIYSHRGLYVVNSRGDAWQTFGDKFMQWYGATYGHVLEAGMTSLKELFLVFYSTADLQSMPAGLEAWANSEAESLAQKSISVMVNNWLTTHPARAYYESIRFPTLLLLPMPVSATWSIKTGEVDKIGIHARFHYPQLQELGYHDPSLDKPSIDFLPSKTGVPAWLIPDLIGPNPTLHTSEDLVRDDPNIASVRFIQDKKVPPTFKGLLIHLGGGFSLDKSHDSNLMLGVGYCPFDDLFLINNISLDLFFQQNFDDVERRFLSITLGAGLKLPESLLKVINAIRGEAGFASGLGSGLNRYGYKLAAGLELPVLPLGFTYAGLTTRLMLQRVDVGPTLDGAYIQLILH